MDKVSGVTCQVSGFGLTPDTRHPTPNCPDTQHRTPRSGLTLVELLVTILIIAILGAMVLGVAAIAGETAREAKSRTMISRLHTLLVEHMDTYKTRRVRLRPQILAGINASTHPDYNSGPEKGQARAYARLYALRELMMMEIPDRWSDILLAPVPSNPTGASDAFYPYYLDSTGTATGRTPLADVYLRRYANIVAANPSLTGEVLTDNQGAECLYMIITIATGDGEARSLFSENDIGDVDGDGAPEFLDGWGQPINFLRWAPGFDSEIQLNANELNGPPIPTNTVWTNAANSDHDPYDMYRVDRPAFRLVPLIFSAGRDETFGIRLVKPYVVFQGLTQSQLSVVPNNPDNWPAIFPWASVEDDPPGGPRVFLGTDNGEGASTDNIHNHLIGER